MAGRILYEVAEEYAGGYCVSGCHAPEGVAYRVQGWEVASDEETVWSGYYARTGMLVCVMVGDDHQWLFDPEDLVPLRDGEYCRECGQIGCAHDGSGYDDEEEAA